MPETLPDPCTLLPGAMGFTPGQHLLWYCCPGGTLGENTTYMQMSRPVEYTALLGTILAKCQ